ncbi:GtrA family protein [Paractinoplanes lichenicola]|uniref:GtrA family protein n=1 Tax=Paractinoplanes lichenicola TaxID=2802976 RepID=A0ABS1W5I9_9ACTN|nr:GtrA family protein [Actinoplanes lichenicola]MBL7262009.1 GtrA family protein [Actinoplanes lichenicola]
MRNAELVRYAISGGASAVTHVGVGFLLAGGLGIRAVLASALGFGASVLVSYGLQRSWVFRSTTGHLVAGRRFLTVTAVALCANSLILWLGTEVLTGPFVLVQAVALVTIPVVNYVLNSHWTFRVP